MAKPTGPKPRQRQGSADPRVRANPAGSDPVAPPRGEWPQSLQWACKFLPHYFSDEPAVFHANLMATLEQGCRRLVALVAPRGHAKSTCAALAFPLWCICEQRCANIVVITHESGLARQFVRDLRQELEDNELLRGTYGDLCRSAPPRRDEGRVHRPKWSEACFHTSTGIAVHARSTGASLRGIRAGPHRPDLIICDDLESDARVFCPAQRAKLARWLQRTVLPALAPHGRLVLLGSLLHRDSLLARLCDRRAFPGWEYTVYRAIEAAAGPDGRFHRVALWPARWPLARLDEERERIGSIAFEQEYQANPAQDEVRVFQPEWLRTYDPAELVPERLTQYMAVDPAVGLRHGDYFALWVGSVDSATQKIYTRELTLRHINVTAQVNQIVEAYLRWRPVQIQIEANGYQQTLARLVAERSVELGLVIPVSAVPSRGTKETRVLSSVPAYERGQFLLPPGLPPEIRAQFLNFPDGPHDDAPDVCAMGIELVGARRVREIQGLTAARRARQPASW